MRDEGVLRAVANEHRRRMLAVLSARGACSYTELMRESGFRLGESGKFAYHLKRLVDAGLVRQLSDGRYSLTREGRRVVAVLAEESNSYTILDALGGFAKKVDVDAFFLGSTLLASGLLLLVFGAVAAALGALGVPYRVEVMGHVYYKHPNVVLAVLGAAAGLLISSLSLRVLKASSPGSSTLELLVYQRYMFLLLSRTGKLGRYVLAYVLAVAATVAAILAMILL